ncbi:MAG: Gldg family protein [Deltaproteobacteria bacterium]|nr:Gldg family protein [Deltaproteobacteria bacterium]
MRAAGIIARKELRAYFDSPVALIFLGVFLLSALVSFFGYSSFFARNMADVRPLFAWLPILLILLVAAISMRQWAEERKMGTLEVLLTLPVSTRDLVIGKFAAGVVLVAVALAMTIPIPLMVSFLGELDWGPVVGGYLGALLLGATYLSIGLCVSARTDNQVVSLMLTFVIGAAFYMVGSEPVTELFGTRSAELLRDLGTGSRFASIERGVIDLRDLAYYVGLGVFFLSLNAYFLEAERIDHGSERGRLHTRKLAGLVAGVGANVVALNLWLAPITALRVDLTQSGEYSISRVTHDALAALDDPLRIDAFFSSRTHPLLAPLVPQIRDLLDEYRIAGAGRVQLEFADPNSDEALEQEIGERYGIRSVPFQVSDRHQQAVVNSFFHILLRYGDQYQTLSFDDLIEVRFDGDELDVRLKNLEYDLTATIRRLSQEFQNVESLLARIPGEPRLTLYVTPQSLPEDLAGVPDHIRNIAVDLVDRSDGRLVFEEVDPSGDAALAEQLFEEHRIRPLAVDLFGQRTFYLDMVLATDAGAQRISPRGGLGESEIRQAIEAGIRRATPGQLKTVGLYSESPPLPPQHQQLPLQMRPPPPQPDYSAIEQLFADAYQMERVDLDRGVVPETIDLLLVGKPGALSDEARFAIDQYLMRGGKMIALAGAFTLDTQNRGLRAVRHESPLFSMLEHWGVRVAPALVMDPQNASFPVPVQEQRGPFRVQRIQMLPYPFFPDVRRDGMAEGQPALAGLRSVTTPWASPLHIDAKDGVQAQVLLESSPGTWIDDSGSIEPDMARFPETGFGAIGEVERRVLAVTLTGTFPSTFADTPSPLFADGEGSGDATGRTIMSSLPDARLVVLASAEMVSDLILQLATQPGGEVHRGNLQLLQNLIDWSLEDTELLTIRSSGGFARTLVPLTEAEARSWEVGTYAACTALLAVATIWPRRRRARVIPIALPAGGAAS